MTDALPTPDPDDPDELLEFETRIGILLDGENRLPTEPEIQMAVDDVREFRKRRSD